MLSFFKGYDAVTGTGLAVLKVRHGKSHVMSASALRCCVVEVETCRTTDLTSRVLHSKHVGFYLVKFPVFCEKGNAQFRFHESPLQAMF
jgi:hypothetical protein